MKAGRLIPSLVVVLIVVFLLAKYLPPYLVYISFKSDLRRFIELIKDGDAYSAVDFVVDDEKEMAYEIVRNHVPQGYETELKALNIRSIERTEEGFTVELVGRFEGENYRGVGRARMKWIRTSDGWRFPISKVMVAEMFGEDWVGLTYYLGYDDFRSTEFSY